MQYYSEDLKKFFKTEDECKAAEAEATKTKEAYETEIKGLETELEKAKTNVNKKLKEIDEKEKELAELSKTRTEIADRLAAKRLEYARKSSYTKGQNGRFCHNCDYDLFPDFSELAKILDQVFDNRITRNKK